jgi:hypothetical protein
LAIVQVRFPFLRSCGKAAIFFIWSKIDVGCGSNVDNFYVE